MEWKATFKVRSFLRSLGYTLSWCSSVDLHGSSGSQFGLELLGFATSVLTHGNFRTIGDV